MGLNIYTVNRKQILITSDGNIKSDQSFSRIFNIFSRYSFERLEGAVTILYGVQKFLTGVLWCQVSSSLQNLVHGCHIPLQTGAKSVNHGQIRDIYAEQVIVTLKYIQTTICRQVLVNNNEIGRLDDRVTYILSSKIEGIKIFEIIFYNCYTVCISLSHMNFINLAA